ncbi:MAG TPA: PAS domain-containing protein [Lysobacter sp.]
MKRIPFLFAGATAMDDRHRNFPWAASPIGAPAQWDTALRTLVPIMLASNQPMFLVWGASRTLLYNDPYARILGKKHPDALGRDFLEVWAEIRADLEPIVTAAYQGAPVQMDDIELWLERHGYREEAHFSFFYAPVRVHSGEVGGFVCACNEITAQIMAERRLAASEARYRGVLQNMDEGFTLFDADFTILEVNDAALAMVGLAREQLVGANHWAQFPGTEAGPVGELYRQTLSDRQPRILEHAYRYPDGREQWFEVRAFPAEHGLAVLFRDISARKRLQAEADAAMERVQLALDAGAIVGTWMWDVPNDRVYADERFATSFGLDPAAVAAGMPIGHAFGSINPEDQPRVRAAVDIALREGTRYRCQYRVLRDGAYRWVEASGRVEFGPDGAPLRFPGVLLDVEDRRRIEDERDRTAALLTTFIGAVPGAVYAKDREGRYLLANRGTAEAFGLPQERMVGRTDVELLPGSADAAALVACDRDVMQSGEARQVEEPLQGADGVARVWWSTKAPLRDAGGAVIGLVGTSVDITERKHMVDALREADKRKDEFLAMLAHELRNPLAPIHTASHILRLSGADSPPVREASEVIARQVRHMTRLVDDLLDVSRVTRGLVELERAPVDLRTVLSTAVEQAQPLMQARRHELRTRVGSGAFVVEGDLHRLVQVVANLLNNAAKYTPRGGVIDVRLGAERGRACLSVTDNGVGIATEMLDRVFDLFSQAERTPDRSEGGLGIGLSLVRSLVQLHGGEVRAHSPGLQQGATFSVVLPLAADLVPTRPDAAAARPGGVLRILVVDDNADALKTLADVLELSGHRAGTAETGAAALALAATHARWDACILDIGLPDMTGYELAAQLRQTPAAREAALIALTGYGQAHDRVVSKAAGFDAHLVKPADVPGLLDLLGRVTAGRRQGADADAR